MGKMTADRLAFWRALSVTTCFVLPVAIAWAARNSPRANVPSLGANSPMAQPAPASAPAYPTPALAKACAIRADGLRRKYKDFEAISEPPFVVAGDLPASALRRHAEGSVIRPARVMWASYFTEKPDKPITILLFDGNSGYGQYARGDYPGGDFPYFGYYTHGTRTMAMNIRTGGGTLVHELTHALIVYDFADVPSWFNEGLASLHEQCTVGERDITGLVNWRLPGLQAAIRERKLRPLRDLVSQRDFYGARGGTNYAQARYFCLYLQKLGLLGKFYKHFRDNHAAADADAAAIEHVLGQKLEAVEKEYVAWVNTLKFE